MAEEDGPVVDVEICVADQIDVLQLGSFVVDQRGHAFTTPVVAVRLDDTAFEARLRAGFSPEDLAQQANWYRLLGLVAPDEDFATAYLDQVAANTAAFYEPTTRQVVLRGTPGGPLDAEDRWVLVHELTHALDDQHFPFDRPEVNDLRTEWLPVGELLTRQLLTQAVGSDAAEHAAAGWGGDRSAIWAQAPAAGGLTCLRTRYVMDTSGDLDELEAAFIVWTRRGKDRSLHREADHHLDVTSCALVPMPGDAID